MTTTNPIRILHVTQPAVAGVPRAVVELVDFQRRAGLDARIAGPDEGELRDLCAERAIPLVPWRSRRGFGPSMRSELRDLRRIIDTFDPDVVHLASAKAGLIGRLVLRGRRTTIFSPHGWSFFVPGRTRAASLRWERVAARWTHQFHVCCDDEARVGIENGITGRYVVGLNGADPQAFGHADADARSEARRTLGRSDAPLVICIGRLCFQKGQDSLIEAWRLVAAERPDAQLVLLGSDEEGLFGEMRAPDSVESLGNRTDIRTWIAAADLVVAPSRYEGLSTAVLESLMVGRAVVAYDAVGMRSLIGDRAGAVVPIDDQAALAAAVLDRLADPARCEAEGLAGRASVLASFSTEVLLPRALEHTLELLRRDEGR